MYRLKWLYYFPFWIYYFVGFVKNYKIMKSLFKESEFKKALEVFRVKTNKEIRQDWIGRLYTVVNVPMEVYVNENLTSTFVMDAVKDIDELLRPFGITEIVTLETLKFESKQFSYFLLIIDYNINPINFLEIFFSLISIVLTILAILFFV